MQLSTDVDLEIIGTPVKNDIDPVIKVQSQIIPQYKRDKPYKYLGKSLSLSGEDSDQINEVVLAYKQLVDNIMTSELPLPLKSSAFNNLALAKILHHFYNSRISELVLDDMEKYLVNAVRELFGLYKSTTRLMIFLPRKYGGLGIKRLSSVYYTTRLSFLVNVLNHDVENFRFISRE